MTEDANKASATAGSADAVKSGGSGNAGESQTAKGGETVPKSEYESLQTKLGEQGRELGELRGFYQEIGPFLQKLDEMPELVEAITKNKVDSKLAQAILDGKVNVVEAAQVAAAHEEVKKDMGQKQYDKADPADIEAKVMAKVEAKLAAIEGKVSGSIAEVNEVRKMERNLDDFIKATPDYPEYAEAILEWFKSHPDQYDISVAYDAVKGKALTLAAQAGKSKAESESRKEAVADAVPAMTGSRKATIVSDDEIIGKFVRTSMNPNRMG